MKPNRSSVVYVVREAWSHILALCAEARLEQRETCWRLLGSKVDGQYKVDAVIGPGPNVDAGPGHVRPNFAWQQTQLELLLAAYPHFKFLGEGHKHPPYYRNLSRTDLKTATAMARDPDYYLDGKVLLMLVVPGVAGLFEVRAWTLDATGTRPALNEHRVVVLDDNDCSHRSHVQVPSPASLENTPSPQSVAAELHTLCSAMGMSMEPTDDDDSLVVRCHFGTAKTAAHFDLRIAQDFPNAAPEVRDARGNRRRALLAWTPQQSLTAFVLSALPPSILKRAHVRLNAHSARAACKPGRMVKLVKRERQEEGR